MELRKGKGFTTGDIISTVKSDDDGQYSFSGVEAGQYTVRMVDKSNREEKYIEDSVNVTVAPGKTAVASDLVVSAAVNGGLRFVLTWGTQAEGAPSDLDSHLYGPACDGGTFHVYYSEDVYGLGNCSVMLDIDDTEYEGPETTTVLKPESRGIYNYYVYRYSSYSSVDDSYY